MEQKNKGGLTVANTQTVVNSFAANVIKVSDNQPDICLSSKEGSRNVLTTMLYSSKKELSTKTNVQILNSDMYISLAETPLTFREIMRQLHISRRTTKCILNQLIIDGLCTSFHIAENTPLLYTCNFRLMEYLKEGGSND